MARGAHKPRPGEVKVAVLERRGGWGSGGGPEPPPEKRGPGSTLVAWVLAFFMALSLLAATSPPWL